MRKFLFFIPLIFLFLLLAGCGGFRKDISECDSMFDSGNKTNCLRELAISMAATGNCQKAGEACDALAKMSGTAAGAPEYFRTQADLCYYDVAKLLADSYFCSKIDVTNSGDVLKGAVATQQMCYEKVDRIISANPKGLCRTYNCVTPPGSTCTQGYDCPLIFFFPLLLIPVLLINKRLF
jgi:hypothetical protein